ncbi:MAG: alpha-ketoglutarate-dependent dioxygenase AlkB [Burkholderiales bacterium]|nr:alpha-ketoglutarate-dependent dioxygenase AlkB [Burkholderiales bacterium]
MTLTSDLFLQTAPTEQLSLADADVSYLRRLLSAESAAQLLQQLIATVPWRAEHIVLWGKPVLQPRLIAWYGDVGANYTYSGVLHRPLPWTPVVLQIKREVEAASGSLFNSVLLNYYRDHRDGMGMHSDDEPELGDRPVIASVSLGEERSIVFRHKRRKELKPVRFRLASGSLLLMRGDTQRNWKHGIDKQARPCGPRVNLTFRRIGKPSP